jgi:hypothetical protein
MFDKNTVMGSDNQQFKFALDDLRAFLKANPSAQKNFTPAQLADIKAGKRGRTKLFVWHHSDEDIYILHLVDRKTHAAKGNHHVGSTSATQRDRKKGGVRK